MSKKDMQKEVAILKLARMLRDSHVAEVMAAHEARKGEEE